MLSDDPPSRSVKAALPQPKPVVPFAGRIGGNQFFSLDSDHCPDVKILEKYPDAAPWVPIRDAFKLVQFLDIELWKAAVIEGLGMFFFILRVGI